MSEDVDTCADVFFDTPAGQVKIAFGPVWAWITWPDGTKEKLAAGEAQRLAHQIAEPN